MEYVHLGNSGLRVSRICLGTMGFGTPGKLFSWTIDETEATQIIKECLDNGINFFDTANIYSDGESEEILGRAIKQYAKREDVVIATKCGIAYGENKANGGLSRRVIFNEVEKSLHRLQTDYIDLFIVHHPDAHTPVEETMRALHDLVTMGKIRYIGASNMAAWQFAKYQYAAKLNGWTSFISLQNTHHILEREDERELFPMLIDMGVSLTAYKVLAGGRLTRDDNETTQRSQTQQLTEKEKRIKARIEDIAKEHQCSKADILVAWELSQKPVDVVLVGTTKVGRISDTVRALKIKLTDENIEKINQLTQ